MAENPQSQCRRPRCDPWFQGTTDRPHMLQRSWVPQLRPGAAKQVKQKYIFLKNSVVASFIREEWKAPKYPSAGKRLNKSSIYYKEWGCSLCSDVISKWGGKEQDAGRCVYRMLPFVWEEKSNSVPIYLQMHDHRINQRQDFSTGRGTS